MLLLAENIVYMWLLPVLAQIILPLLMLFVWMVSRTVGLTSRKSKEAEELLPRVSGQSAEKIA